MGEREIDDCECTPSTQLPDDAGADTRAWAADNSDLSGECLFGHDYDDDGGGGYYRESSMMLFQK